MERSNLRQFGYVKVAQLETASWHSYFNHQFFKMFLQLLQLMRSQLKLNWFHTFRLAYHSGFAAMYYRLRKGRGNPDIPIKHLTKFYQIISTHCTEPFDYQAAARLEFAWWELPRLSDKDKSRLATDLSIAAAAVYNVSPEKLTEYGNYRAEAMFSPLNKGDSHSSSPRYAKIEQLLTKSWQSLHASIQPK
jgi:hypothetical protein